MSIIKTIMHHSWILYSSPWTRLLYHTNTFHLL